MHRKCKEYRADVQRKITAYHVYLQLGCIAQGLLLHLALNHATIVWNRFRSWLRTMNPQRPPSELVVAHALRADLPLFFTDCAYDSTQKKFLDHYRRQNDAADFAENAA